MVGKTPRVRGRYTKYTRHYNKDWENVPEFASFRVKTKESKERDLVLAAHVACHSSVRTIDHLGEIINCISSEGNRQPPLKLHRTKCSKIICKVISPCMQRDLVKDVGDCWFSLIIDESTDTTTMKHLAIMIKYYSHKHKCMILDFLGLVETPECTATILYNVIKEFLKKIGLNIKKILALGTDGAANLCGAHHSALTDGQKPPLLVKLATTRWLSWYGAVNSELRHLFRQAADADPEKKKCPMAHQLAALHEDGSHLLYLAFLKPILRELTSINTLFQSSAADIAVVYRDLKAFVFTVAKAVVKPEALRQTQPGGMLRISELQALKMAILRNENLKARELVNYGEGFWKVAAEVKLPKEKMDEVQRCCKDFLVKFTHELVNRLPSCIEAVEGMRGFTPSVALASRGRPEFKQLPLSLVRDPSIDMEAMEAQWYKLGNMKIEDICPGVDDIDTLDIMTFWTHVYDLKTGIGKQVFPDLARFVLAALSLPLSNAVVERLFSVLGIVKCKLRNKLSTEMLDALLRIRTHFHARGMCCNQFQPTDEMVANFNSKRMYASSQRRDPSQAGPSNAEDDEWVVDNPEEVQEEIAVGLTNEDGDVDNATASGNPEEYNEIFDILAELDVHILN
ncbi:hypothetical protein FOCC_FOCC016169 [Frankliniella occidentalis]|nr:hypothetical protein FOCC_FOCC016169 [Frankliniella occidentalis]